jgi:20S proteasome subunit alpha 6
MASAMGPSRGGGPVGRGGSQMGQMGRGGKPAFQNAGRGGNAGSNRGGRGGSMYGNMGGRGAAPGGGGGPLKPHGSRGGFHGNQHNRRGGSFNASSMQAQPMGSGGGSFRARGPGGRGHNHGTRHDGYGGPGSGSAPSGPNSSFGSLSHASKKEENRRTLTDFKIIGLQIADLQWSWGVVPSIVADVTVEEEEEEEEGVKAGATTKYSKDDEPVEQTEPKSETEVLVGDTDVADINGHVKAEEDTPEIPPPSTLTSPIVPPPKVEQADNGVSPPPSRIRIYFHTPVSADDARPIPHTVVGSNESPDSSRKGKRKKGNDSDDDTEEARPRPPPPGEDHDRESVAPSVGMERGSVAPSVAESSEGDWLMAAITAEGGSEEVYGGEHDLSHRGQEGHEQDGEHDQKLILGTSGEEEHGEHCLSLFQ